MDAVKLRQDTVRSLQFFGSHSKAQCIYWDDSLPAFGVRVYPMGKQSYVYSYRTNGRKRLATIGRVDVLTLDIARKKARTALAQVIDGKDPQDAEDALKASPTVKTLCSEYLERHAKLKKKTWRNDQYSLDKHVIPILGARLSASITTDDMSRLHSDIGKAAPYAANRILEIVRKVFNLAHQWARVPKGFVNPAVGIQRFAERKRRRYVRTEEMPRLARALESEPNDFAREALWLLILIGVRKSELLNAKWTDIDWAERTLYVGQTKNGDPVLAPLSRAAIARLKRIPRVEGNPHIICGTVDGNALVNLNKVWLRVRKDAELEDVRIHDLRRTVGSWLVREGASLHLVGAVLNHKDQKTTAGYAYFQTEDRTQVLDRHGLRVQKFAKSKSIKRQTERRPPLTLTRRALYELVWSRSISSLSKEFGVSDVGLAKACRRATVPVPNRGYWAKRAAGKDVTKTVLSVAIPESAVVRIPRARKQALTETPPFVRDAA